MSEQERERESVCVCVCVSEIRREIERQKNISKSKIDKVRERQRGLPWDMTLSSRSIGKLFTERNKKML